MEKGKKKALLLAAALSVLVVIIIAYLFALGILDLLAPCGTPPKQAFQAFTPTVCYGMQSPYSMGGINTNGLLSIGFAQYTGGTQYNVEMACVESWGDNFSNTNITSPISAWSVISSTGAVEYPVNNAPISGALTLADNYTVTISGLPCYQSNGQRIATNSSKIPRGTIFQGRVLIKYTDDSCDPNQGACKWHTVEVGLVSTKVT